MQPFSKISLDPSLTILTILDRREANLNPVFCEHLMIVTVLSNGSRQVVGECCFFISVRVGVYRLSSSFLDIADILIICCFQHFITYKGGKIRSSRYDYSAIFSAKKSSFSQFLILSLIFVNEENVTVNPCLELSFHAATPNFHL